MTSESFAPDEASMDAGIEAPPAEKIKKQRMLRDVALLLAKHEVRNMKRWFEEFDRDIMLPILLGEIALHNIGTPSPGAGDGDDALPECTLKPCNAYSIAAATGLPRETVRRKVARLVELGWVSRRKNGHLYVSSSALHHFGHLMSSRELPDLIDTADRARRLLGD